MGKIIDSRELALVVGRAHSRVLQDIRALIPFIYEDYIGEYSDKYGRKQTCYYFPIPVAVMLIEKYTLQARYSNFNKHYKAKVMQFLQTIEKIQ